MDCENEVVITVAENPDAEGYVVQVEALGRVAHWPQPTFEDAEALARSFLKYVEVGCPVGPLVGLDEDEEG